MMSSMARRDQRLVRWAWPLNISLLKVCPSRTFAMHLNLWLHLDVSCVKNHFLPRWRHQLLSSLFRKDEYFKAALTLSVKRSRLLPFTTPAPENILANAPVLTWHQNFYLQKIRHFPLQNCLRRRCSEDELYPERLIVAVLPVMFLSTLHVTGFKGGDSVVKKYVIALVN